MYTFCKLFCVSFFVSLSFCHRNELLGLEGMMKIKNPDDNNIISSSSVVSIDPKASTFGHNSQHDIDVRRL